MSGLIGKEPNPDVNIETPAGGGPRGTEFTVRYDEPNVEYDLISGALAITPKQTHKTTEFKTPIKIVSDGSATRTSTLTQAQYDAITAQFFPVP